MKIRFFRDQKINNLALSKLMKSSLLFQKYSLVRLVELNRRLQKGILSVNFLNILDLSRYQLQRYHVSFRTFRVVSRGNFADITQID